MFKDVLKTVSTAIKYLIARAECVRLFLTQTRVSCERHSLNSDDVASDTEKAAGGLLVGQDEQFSFVQVYRFNSRQRRVRELWIGPWAIKLRWPVCNISGAVWPKELR